MNNEQLSIQIKIVGEANWGVDFPPPIFPLCCRDSATHRLFLAQKWCVRRE